MTQSSPSLFQCRLFEHIIEEFSVLVRFCFLLFLLTAIFVLTTDLADKVFWVLQACSDSNGTSAAVYTSRIKCLCSGLGLKSTEHGLSL